MSRRRGILGLLVLLALCGGAPSAHAASTKGYIVLYKDSVSQPAAATDRREDREGFRARHRYDRVGKGFAAKLTAGQVAALQADPNVASVEPDFQVHLLALAPVAAGDGVPAGVRRVGATPSTGLARGASSVGVAVVDTGIANPNGDLNVQGGTNCVSPGQSYADDNGHGTHVAGTIGARNNGSGVVGVAPGTSLYAVKVFPANGQVADWSTIMCGLQWVVQWNADHAGDPASTIKVVNMSLGGACTGACTSTTEQAAVQAVVDAGVTVVAAAGNDDVPAENYIPARFPGVLTATAMGDFDGVPGGNAGVVCTDGDTASPPRYGNTQDDQAAGFSNYATTAAVESHTIAAPGSCVQSDLYTGGTTYLSGTSMASPHVAGVAALCFGENGGTGPCTGLSPSAVIGKLRSDAAAHATASNGFAGDPFSPIVGRYYGNLAWASAPGATTQTPTDVTTTTATLRGTVDPAGSSTTYHFEYGATQALGSSTATIGAGSAQGGQAVTAAVGSLAPGQAYWYRVVATGPTGSYGGALQSFATTATPPTVTASTASSIGETEATLNGAVDPNGFATSWHFEYRPAIPAGGSWTSVAATPGSGSGGSPVTTSATIGGLSPSTQYEFRIVATRATGGPWTAGAPSFETADPSPPTATTPTETTPTTTTPTETVATPLDSPASTQASLSPTASPSTSTGLSQTQPSPALSHTVTRLSTSLSLTKAKSLLKSYVRGRLGKGATAPASKCSRSTSSQVRCSVSWRTAKERYTGTFVVRLALVRSRLVTTRSFDGKRTKTACPAAAKRSCRSSTVHWR